MLHKHGTSIPTIEQDRSKQRVICHNKFSVFVYKGDMSQHIAFCMFN